MYMLTFDNSVNVPYFRSEFKILLGKIAPTRRTGETS